jgi:hypothetical protein
MQKMSEKIQNSVMREDSSQGIGKPTGSESEGDSEKQHFF